MADKFCVDCKFFYPNPNRHLRKLPAHGLCIHHLKSKTTYLVTGQTTTDDYNHCSTERRLDYPQYCGLEGKFWEAKNA